MSITFNEIPQTNWDLPRTAGEIRPIYNNAGVFQYPNLMLIFAPKLASGPGAVLTPFQVTRLADVTYRAGAGSIAEDMAADILAANPYANLWMILIAETGGAAVATGSFAFTGTATKAGTLARYIGGRRVAVPVTMGATAASVATALAAAIGAIPNMPVTAAAATGTVTVTSKHKADLANSITLKANLAPDEVTPAGLTEVITPMASGAGALDLTAAISAIAATWFPYWVLPVTDSTNLGLVVTELKRRYSATGHQDAFAFTGKADILSALTTWLPQQNYELLFTQTAPAGQVEAPWRLAAMLAAQAAFALSQDPSRQLRTLPLVGLRPPVGGNFIDTERNLIVLAGGTTFNVAQDGTCSIERCVSTRTADDNGVATKAWQDIMTAAVMSQIRYDFRSYWRANYPRHKLADDGHPAAQASDNIITPNGALAVWAARCKVYEALGWIDRLDETLALCRVQRPADGTRNRLQMRLVVRVIDNLMQTDMALEFQA